MTAVLFSFQILFSTGIHFDGHAFQSGILGDVLADSVSRFHTVKVFVDGFDDLFAEIIREFIGGNDDAFHGYGADIFFLSRIGTLRYGDLGEVWILLHQLVHMFCIDIDQCCGFIGSQILDRCGREACDDDTDIDIAILQCISSFAEGEILYIDIIIGQTIRAEDLTSIGFCAGAGSTDSDLLPLRSAMDLMPLSAVVTNWTVSG